IALPQSSDPHRSKNGRNLVSPRSSLPGPGPALIGTGEDMKLYTKGYSERKWDGPLRSSCCMMRIAVMPDGSLLGVGEDNQLYTKTSIYSGNWKVVEGSCCIQDVAVKQDGTIIAVSSATGTKLMTRPDLNSEWTTSRKFNDVVRIDVLPDGTVLGVTKTGGLKRRVGGFDGTWQYQNSFGMKADDISIQPDGIVLGIEKGGCGVHALDLETGKWGEQLPESECVTAIASPGNLIFPEATEEPTTVEPTEAPTEAPTDAPTEAPTDAPTEAPTDAPPPPPPPSKYQVFTDLVKNRDAYGECYKRGMMLAVPHDKSAYNDIVNAIKAKGTLDAKRFWFGIRSIDGEIKTIYGSNAYYRAFAPNEPSGDGGCISLSVEKDYKYDDVTCGSQGMSVCEPLEIDPTEKPTMNLHHDKQSTSPYLR
uniref:Uncharacterized protein LOC102808010 n=1 Tax=Saccoglossus kowalevskii TaxID=10224 RepID=A0ABM0M7V5_SACKO